MKLLSISTRTAAIVAASALAFMGWVPRPAQAQWAVECVNCSSWMQQMMQYAEQAETALNTARQLETQIKQYNAMIQQGMALPNQVWGDFQSDMNQLNAIVAQGRNIAYATRNLDDQFKKAFPNYRQMGKTAASPSDLQAAYDRWTAESYDAARTSLKVAAQQSQAMHTTEATQLATLANHSQSAVGQMQAIQAGNEIAMAQVQQMQKLRQLVMTQMDMQAQAMGARTRSAEMERAKWKQWHSDPSTVKDPHASHDAGLNLNQ